MVVTLRVLVNRGDVAGREINTKQLMSQEIPLS